MHAMSQSRSLSREIEELGPWYHVIDVGGGQSTPGRSPAAKKFEALEPHLPALDGQRVLDLGCNAGGIAVEFAKRGATVVGIEATKHYHRQAMWVRDRLGLGRFTPLHMPIYGIGSLNQRFDVVVFSGLIYHLRYPQLALDLVARVCDGIMFITTPQVVTDAAVLESRLPPITARIPQEEEAAYNWWFPSESALLRMLTAAGFYDITVLKRTTTGFRSSSDVDNTSAFSTGSIELKARCRADGTVPKLPGPSAPPIVLARRALAAVGARSLGQSARSRRSTPS